MPSAPQIITKKAAIWLGILGIAGSLVLFAGDMLFYYNGEQSDLLANMAHASPERIIASGLCALIAAWLYVAGAGQIYYAFQPASAGMRWSVFFTFVMIATAYGVIHGAYIGIAVSAQNAAALGLPLKEWSQVAIAANQAMRKLVYLPFGIFTIGFTIGVWRKRTHYPRWILAFSPIIPFLLQGMVVGNLAGRARTIIGGGYLNGILLLFFAASTIALKRDNRA